MGKAEHIDDILAGVRTAIGIAALRKTEGRADAELQPGTVLRDAEAEKDYEDWRYYILQAQAGGDE